MVIYKTMAIVTPMLLIAAGTGPSDEHTSTPDQAILWAAHSAEYQAVSAQVYAQATRDLPEFLSDESWSALPGHDDEQGKPPAIILDVDETVVSNSDVELTMIPYSTLLHFEWADQHKAIPIRGVTDFIAAAQSLGIEVFFVTNRPCEEFDSYDGTCPMEQVTIDDIVEIGIETDGDHVLLAYEKPDWGKEKSVRREFVGATHRVIMLIGDDYGDFVDCARAKPVAPCTIAATRKGRTEALDTYANYWGNGWYILPNPMYGSWTSVR